jgi:hypothetical protein
MWLDRYVGTWECSDQHYAVTRRPDGWLAARTVSGTPASLKWVLENGKRIQPPPSPLGVYPVMLSDTLMRVWLKPEEYERLSNAWRVGPGMQMILEAIERNVRESDDLTRKEKFGRLWAAHGSYSEPLTEEDAELCEVLMAEYRSKSGIDEIAGSYDPAKETEPTPPEPTDPTSELIGTNTLDLLKSCRLKGFIILSDHQPQKPPK